MGKYTQVLVTVKSTLETSLDVKSSAQQGPNRPGEIVHYIVRHVFIKGLVVE